MELCKFCRFILIFHQMLLIFPWVPIVFTRSGFEYSPRKWKCSVPAFRKWRHFLSSHVLVSDNCKQFTIVWFLLLTFYWFYWHCKSDSYRLFTIIGHDEKWGYLRKAAFSFPGKYSKLDSMNTVGTCRKINAIWWNIKINLQKIVAMNW